jgi:hypothetical protein
MSRKNYTHTMDAFIHGNKWSNFSAPTITELQSLSSVTRTPRTYTAAPTGLVEVDYEGNRTSVTPTPTPIPTPTPVVSPTPIVAPIQETTPPIIAAPKEPTYFKSVDTDTRLNAQPIQSPYAVGLSNSDEIVGRNVGTRHEPIAGVPPTPVINVITTPVLPSTPIAVTPAPIKGSGGFGGGGGGAMPISGEKPKVSSVAQKPSFLKKNWLPIVLVVSAIYVYIKKPI